MPDGIEFAVNVTVKLFFSLTPLKLSDSGSTTSLTASVCEVTETLSSLKSNREGWVIKVLDAICFTGGTAEFPGCGMLDEI